MDTGVSLDDDLASVSSNTKYHPSLHLRENKMSSNNPDWYAWKQLVVLYKPLVV
jgi:hypothetical protein